jgi:cell division septum initiation protein DivIVA
MSDDKDVLIHSLFKEIQKIREENDALKEKVGELSQSPPISLSQIQATANETELSESTRSNIDKAVDLVLAYAKKVNFV